MFKVRDYSVTFMQLLVWVLFFGPCWSSKLFAEERELKTDTKEKVDAVLLLDGSGSMLRTDPLKLREEGAKLFVQFLKPGDRLAIVEFADKGRIIRPLVAYETLQEKEVWEDIKKVGSEGPYTDILSGLRIAKRLLDDDPREDASRVIILLSDGKMEPDPVEGSAILLTNSLLNEELPELKSEEIKVHTLSFSDQADKELLSQIARATDASHWFSPSADKIHESYAELFIAVKKPQILPLTTKGFAIDADIQEATFYVNTEGASEIKLQSPSGSILTADAKSDTLRWFKGQKFDVVTIWKPEPGSWQILGLPGQEGFATLLTNLKLTTDWPSDIYAGTPALLQARLYESEKPLALPEMSGVTQYAFQVTPTDKVSEPIIRDFLVDDGSKGDKIAKDGIFSATITLEETGEYKLRILANSPTFERHQQIPFRLKKPLISLSVVAQAGSHAGHSGAAGGHEGSPHAAVDAQHKLADEEHHAEEAHHSDNNAAEHASTTPTKDYFRVELSEEAGALKKAQVKLVATDKERNRFIVPLEQSHESPLIYEASSWILREGEYKLQATFAAEGRGKKEVRAESKTIAYKRVPGEGDESEEEVEEIVIVKEEKKEFPLSALIIMSVLNIGVGTTFLVLLRRTQSGVATTLPELAPLDPMLKFITELEAKIMLGEVDINDPIFLQENGTAGSQAETSAKEDLNNVSSTASDTQIHSDAAVDEADISESAEPGSDGGASAETPEEMSGEEKG